MKRGTLSLLLILVFLTACQGVKFGMTKEQAAALPDNAHIGVKGVTFEFIKNNPPDIVFTGSPLDIIVELKNEGAAPVIGGTIYLSGYDSRMFNIQPQYATFDLEGRTKFNTYGGYDTKEFSSDNIYLPQGTDTLDQPFQVSICYRYRTEARIPVCVDPNPISVLENEICDVKKPVFVGGGQGGPVAVTAVKEEAAPGQVNFLITIADQGTNPGDTVVDQFSLSRCPSPLKYNDVDTVQYSVRMQGADGTCKPESKARLANKQGTIYCTFQLTDSTSSAYTSVLEINLDYGYLSQKSKTVKVKSLT